MVNKSPNILVIQADQLNPDMLGVYQNPIYDSGRTNATH